MRKQYAIIFLCLSVILSACKKESASFSGQLVGKWHETKLNLHRTDGGTVLQDTTFTGDNFTDADFYLFNRDKTATISKSGNFSFGGKAIVLNADVLFDFVTHYTYTTTDSTVSIKVTGIPANITTNSAGQPYDQTLSIVQVDSNHLILRSMIFYDYYLATGQSATSGLVTTAYFTKE